MNKLKEKLFKKVLTNHSLYGIIVVSKGDTPEMKGFDYMTILDVVNKAKGCAVRIQIMRDGYTQFIADDETTNFLLLGRTKNTPVEKIAVDKDGALHIYGINYLNYQR